MTSKHAVLIVDDSPETVERLKRKCASLGLQALAAPDQDTAERLLLQHQVCLVLLDLDLPFNADSGSEIETGFNLLRWVRGRPGTAKLPVIVVSVHGRDSQVVIKAFKLGATDFAQKHFEGNAQTIEDKILEALGKSCGVGCTSATMNAVLDGSAKQGRARTYSSSRRLHFQGERQGKRCRLFLDRDERWIGAMTFENLFTIAMGDRNWAEHPAGYVRGSEISVNMSTTLVRMAKDLPELHELIERDGDGGYRIACPPENVTFDADILRTEHKQLLMLVPEAAACA